MFRNKKIVLCSIGFFIFAFFLLTLPGCPTEPPIDNTPPGRRDYVWTVDSLKAEDFFGITDVWGDSPNSIWLVAVGTSAKDCLWFYDEVKWKKSSQILSPSLNTVFGITSDDLWIGDDYGTFWRNTGNGWQKFQEISVNGFDRTIIASIYGTSKNNLYAVGGADNNDGSGYKGIILKYDGKKWELLDIPDIKVGFNDIKGIGDGKYLITATNFDNGFLDKIFVYNGTNVLKEIYSDYSWPSMYQINGKTYITINRKIYKYNNDRLELWRDFSASGYIGVVLGRSEKDLFCTGYEGIMHYNGNDLKVLYPLELAISGLLIFEEKVFFAGHNPESGKYIIIEGTLKEE